MSGSQLSVVVATYNEAGNIAGVVERLSVALSGIDWEVVFVDDNSPDGTIDVALQLARTDTRVRGVLRVRNRGLANSTTQGMLSGNGAILCAMDADGQHDPSVIREMLAPILAGEADVVSAARRLDDTLDAGALGPFRLKLSRFGNWLSRLVLRREIADAMTGFFAIRREAFVRVAPKLGDSGFRLLFDMLSSDPALRHREVYFDFGRRMHGQSKLDSFVAWQFLTFIISKLTRGIVPPALVSFLFVGGTGVFVHLAVLYAMLAASGNFATSQAMASLVAVTSNFLLNNRLTFRDRRLRGGRLLVGYLKFLVISSIGIVANVSLATYTYDRVGGIAIVAAFAGIALDTLWKFVVSNRVVWR